MIAAVTLVALVLGAEPVSTAAAALPDDPVRPLVRARCQTCHSADYLGQQRLTVAQWEKTVEKMRKFGAVVKDEEVGPIAAYLARSWPVDAPEARPAPVKAPRGGLAPASGR